MSEQPKLPPGTPVDINIDRSPRHLQANIDYLWAEWEKRSSLTRDQYEAMERALEFVRRVAETPEHVVHDLVEEARAILQVFGDE